MADTAVWMHRRASMADMQRRAGELAYLNDAGKILSALRYEFGQDATLPSRAYVQGIVDRRRAALAFQRRDTLEVLA